jgi:hypothetical protein
MRQPASERNFHMGFYIRKGFNFGPVRLNLSRSGLGASVGVMGARIGVGPRGSYVHVGRGGLYYRQTISPGQSGGSSPAAPVTQPNVGFEDIGSTTRAVDMVDESASQLLQELNRVKRRVDLFPAVLIVGLAGVLYCVYLMSIGWWVSFLGIIVLPLLAFCARHLDVTNGTAIVQYSLEPDAQQKFQDFCAAFEKVRNCRVVWHVDASGQTNDWKRNAGAGSIARRSNARLLVTRPPRVQCNLPVPALEKAGLSFYFFPDRLLIYDSSGVGAVSYGQLQVDYEETRFVEDGPVPVDARSVGTTWQYVNKNGSPDRRFTNNRQFPILLYGGLVLRSQSGVNERFQFSNHEFASGFRTAILSLATHLEVQSA